MKRTIPISLKWWATLKWSFYVSFCLPSAHPFDHKNLSWHCPCPLSDVLPAANTVGSILYDVYTLGQNTLGQIYKHVFILSIYYALKCKHRIGLTPLYRPQVGRRTRAMSGEVFLWSDGPSVGGESDGEGHCRTADGGRTEVFTSF